MRDSVEGAPDHQIGCICRTSDTDSELAVVDEGCELTVWATSATNSWKSRFMLIKSSKIGVDKVVRISIHGVLF